MASEFFHRMFGGRSTMRRCTIAALVAVLVLEIFQFSYEQHVFRFRGSNLNNPENHNVPTLAASRVDSCCLNELFLWPSPRFKGLNNQLNQIIYFAALGSLMKNATLITPKIESNYDPNTRDDATNNYVRLESFDRVNSTRDGSYLLPFEYIYDVSFLRSTMLKSKKHKLCVISEAEAEHICRLNLKNSTLIPFARYKDHLITADLFEAFFRNESTSSRLASFKKIQSISSPIMSMNHFGSAALFHPDSPRFWPIKRQFISRSAFDWFQSLQGIFAGGLMRPGSLLKNVFLAAIRNKGRYNGLQLRIEADVMNKSKLSVNNIIAFLLTNNIPTTIPLYVAFSGNLEPYRERFRINGYNITSKLEWAPEIIDVSKGHREVLAFFEQLVLFESEFFVGTTESTLSFYVMAARAQANNRPSLDYLPRKVIRTSELRKKKGVGHRHLRRSTTRASCCQSGIPYDISRASAGYFFQVTTIYKIVFWFSSSSTNLMDSGIFMNSLKDELERRGHDIFVIDTTFGDRERQEERLFPKDIDLHIIYEMRFPSMFFTKYLDSEGRNPQVKVLVRIDGANTTKEHMLLRKISNHTTSIIFESEWSRELTLSSADLAKRIPRNVNKFVVGNAADPFEFFPPISPRQLMKDRRFRVGMIVSSSARKQELDLISYLADQFDKLESELVVVGNLPQSFHKNRSGFVSFSSLEKREMGPFFRNRIDAFLGLHCQDCCGNSVAQAMSTGLPIIAPNLACCSDIVKRGGVFYGQERDRLSISGALNELRSRYNDYIREVRAPKIQRVAKDFLHAAGLEG